MYRQFSWAVLASALIACGGDAPTAPAASLALGNAPVLSVTGSVHFTNPDFFGNPVEVRMISFNAKKNENGEVSGRFEYHQVFLGNTFKFTGEMTCLSVRGNRAWLGARVLDATNPARIGQFGWWQVTDNGEGANDDADLGGLVGVGSEERNEQYCADQPDDISAVGPFPAKGNVQIR
jgi:hypothetical protein